MTGFLLPWQYSVYPLAVLALGPTILVFVLKPHKIQVEIIPD